jgi:O-antigen ligase
MGAGIGRLEWGGLLFVATASVVLFGAVEERFLAPLEVVLFALAAVSVVRRRRHHLPPWSPHPAALPLLVILGVGALQLLPLPAALTRSLSPGMAAVYDGVPVQSVTLPLSVYPYATELAVLRLAAYAVFFLLVLDAVSTPARVRAALVWAAGLGTAVALYGLLNHLSGNTRLLWLPRRFYAESATGTFVNRNHFAALMVLLLPTVLACYWTRPRMPRTGAARGDAAARLAFFLLCGAAMCLGLLFSKSRGGILCGTLALAGLVLVLHRYGGRSARMRTMLPLACVAVAVAWAAYIGTGGIIERFAQLAGPAAPASGRGGQWTDTVRLIRDFPILGSGLGTYEFLYPMYKTLRVQAAFAHAHNDYLELCAETGLVGLALLGWGLARVFRYGLGVRGRGFGLAPVVVWTLLAGTAGMLLHSLVDFGLHIPGNVFCALTVTAVAIRVAEDPGLVVAPPAALYRRRPSDSRTTS